MAWSISSQSLSLRSDSSFEVIDKESTNSVNGNGSSSFQKDFELELCRPRSCPPCYQCPTCDIETEEMQPSKSTPSDFSNSDESSRCHNSEEHFQPRKVVQPLVAVGSNSVCVSRMRLQQHHQRRLRSKHLKQLFPEAGIERQTDVLRARLIPTSTGLLTILMVLLGIIFAVSRFSREDSTRIAELKDKLALAELEHAKDILNQSSEYGRREAESHQFITTLQEERQRLLQDLQLRSEEVTALQAELDELRAELGDVRSKFEHGEHMGCKNSIDSAEGSAATVTELRAERLKLMDAVSGADRQLREKEAVVKQLRTERDELRMTLNKMFAAGILTVLVVLLGIIFVWQSMRNSVKEIRRDYVHLPGARFLRRKLCEIFGICPDFDD